VGPKDYWNKIGVLLPHKDGKGFDLALETRAPPLRNLNQSQKPNVESATTNTCIRVTSVSPGPQQGVYKYSESMQMHELVFAICVSGFSQNPTRAQRDDSLKVPSPLAVLFCRPFWQVSRSSRTIDNQRNWRNAQCFENADWKKAVPRGARSEVD
jgi:hypothetical protein